MLKIIKHIFLIFILIMPLFVFSQYSVLPISTQKEINRLNEIINKSLRKYKAFSNKDTTVQLFTFFQFRIMDTISKNELVDGSFLQKLNPLYVCYRKGRSYPPKKYTDSLLSATTFIYSSEKKVTAIFKDHRTHKPKCSFVSIEDKNFGRPPYYDALVKHIWDKKNILVFFGVDILRDISTFFIVNEQLEILVFYENRKNGNYKVVPIREYLDEIGIDYLNARGGRIRN